MPATWQSWSTDVFGYVAKQTPDNERHVVETVIGWWVEKGLSDQQVFLRYNAGYATQCSSGVNSLGVRYDSCAYVAHGMNHLALLY